MVREPRQVRKEAAVSDRLRVPRENLAGAGLEGECELVLIDTPPLLPVTDAAAVEMMSDRYARLANLWDKAREGASK